MVDYKKRERSKNVEIRGADDKVTPAEQFWGGVIGTGGNIQNFVRGSLHTPMRLKGGPGKKWTDEGDLPAIPKTWAEEEAERQYRKRRGGDLIDWSPLPGTARYNKNAMPFMGTVSGKGGGNAKGGPFANLKGEVFGRPVLRDIASPIWGSDRTVAGKDEARLPRGEKGMTGEPSDSQLATRRVRSVEIDLRTGMPKKDIPSLGYAGGNGPRLTAEEVAPVPAIPKSRRMMASEAFDGSFGSFGADAVAIPASYIKGYVPTAQKVAARGGLSEDDLDLLAYALLGEAEGEGAVGMQAVANVIRNRAKPGNKFPDNPIDVVKEPKQFSTFNAGKGGNQDAVKKRNPKDSARFKEARTIAANVFSGYAKDNTNGSLYYHTTNIKPNWASDVKTDAGTLKIGNHVFYPEGKPGSPAIAPTPATRSAVRMDPFKEGASPLDFSSVLKGNAAIIPADYVQRRAREAMLGGQNVGNGQPATVAVPRVPTLSAPGAGLSQAQKQALAAVPVAPTAPSRQVKVSTPNLVVPKQSRLNEALNYSSGQAALSVTPSFSRAADQYVPLYEPTTSRGLKTGLGGLLDARSVSPAKLNPAAKPKVSVAPKTELQRRAPLPGLNIPTVRPTVVAAAKPKAPSTAATGIAAAAKVAAAQPKPKVATTSAPGAGLTAAQRYAMAALPAPVPATRAKAPYETFMSATTPVPRPVVAPKIPAVAATGNTIPSKIPSTAATGYTHNWGIPAKKPEPVVAKVPLPRPRPEVTPTRQVATGPKFKEQLGPIVGSPPYAPTAYKPTIKPAAMSAPMVTDDFVLANGQKYGDFNKKTREMLATPMPGPGKVDFNVTGVPLEALLTAPQVKDKRSLYQQANDGAFANATRDDLNAMGLPSNARISGGYAYVPDGNGGWKRIGSLAQPKTAMELLRGGLTPTPKTAVLTRTSIPKAPARSSGFNPMPLFGQGGLFGGGLLGMGVRAVGTNMAGNRATGLLPGMGAAMNAPILLTPQQAQNQNPAALAALAQGQTSYVNSDTNMLMPTVSVSGKVRNTYGD